MKSKVGETITWLWWRRIGLLNNLKRKNPFADLLRVMAVKMRWKVLRNRRQDSELGEAEMNCVSPWAIPRWRVGGNFTTDSEQNKWENAVQPTMWFTFPASLTPKIFLSNDGKFVKRKFLWRNFVWCFVAFSVTFCVFFYFCHPPKQMKSEDFNCDPPLNCSRLFVSQSVGAVNPLSTYVTNNKYFFYFSLINTSINCFSQFFPLKWKRSSQPIVPKCGGRVAKIARPSIVL